ncbi:MAG: tryptophan synthase subunit alpha [Helicobacteraceae bacterium]|jgi:tryptophan synthase alpha chain|nr:tryptophan synthase subunit alpha [Helicobacteraceae bacterium]
MKKLTGYLTPKLPDNAFTIDLANAMFDAGMDALEIGAPFSDPIADGATIEKASHLALRNGFIFDDLKVISAALKGRDLIWMGYTNPFLRRGMEKTVKEAAALGVSALVIPDLPHEEAQTYRSLFQENKLDLIEFIAPTTPKDRIAKILRGAKKFIYLVAYAGVTGAAQSEDLQEILAAIKAVSQTPVYVGFGVNRGTAKARAKGADGVIAGSCFVKILLDDALSNNEKIKRICDEARAIKEAIA